jgi:putative copper export protein
MGLHAVAGRVTAGAPSTPLGPFEDSGISWATWVTLMGFVGLVALALLSTGPAAHAIGGGAVATTTRRLAAVALGLGALAIPAVLTDMAHDASENGGYDYGAAWRTLFDGTNEGRLAGLEITCVVIGLVLIAPLVVRGVASGAARAWLLGGGLLTGAVALGTTKFPTKVPTRWAYTSFETLSWMLHLLGAAIWLGGLVGMVLLLVPGALPVAGRGEFWSIAMRRFSAIAMTCVGGIALSGLFLYWEHVDGPTQLFTTMYGRVLGVKILIFGTLLALGAFNQFWLHPRVEALRAVGDDRPLRTILAKRFPVVVGTEAVLGVAVLFVAPFLHGSARNQAFQEDASKTLAAGEKLPRIAAKHVEAGTWAWGIAETLLVIAIMAVGYRLSGRLARNRSDSASTSGGPRAGDLVGAPS